MNMTPKMIQISINDALSNLEYLMTLLSEPVASDGWKIPIASRELESAMQKLETLKKQVNP